MIYPIRYNITIAYMYMYIYAYMYADLKRLTCMLQIFCLGLDLQNRKIFDITIYIFLYRIRFYRIVQLN